MKVPGSLGPEQRSAALDRLRHEHFDVLVIGGGVIGAGCALDAAARGLRVALVEQRDLASGTSSRSSKLMHGGLRYLEQRDFALVQEALRERGLMIEKLCPHLVRPVPFLLPIPDRHWSRFYYGAGVMLYDTLATAGRTNSLPWHRHLSKGAALRLAPGLDPSALAGAIRYHDAQVDDARHTLAVARTAAIHGAAIATSVQVSDLIMEDGIMEDGVMEEGRVVGVNLYDVEGGERIEARATRVVNAAGVWSGQIQAMAGSVGIDIRAAKGVHLVVPRSCIEGETALILRTKTSVLLVIPWGAHWLIGTTDTDWSGDLADPAASRADIDYLLEQANRALRRPLTADDVVGVYAGLRPLVDAGSEPTAKLSREHVVAEPTPGLVTIAGGKYTTYRVMAADAIDTVVDGLVADDGGREVPSSPTADVPLIGAEDWVTWSTRGPDLAAEHGLPEPLVERLLRRHGSRLGDVLAILDEGDHLAEPLPGGDYLAAEVVHAARHEGALHLDDILARRTRLSFESADRGEEAAPIAARLLGAELGWNQARIEAEVTAWSERIRAERAAAQAPTDSEADRARRTASDVRSLLGA